MAGSVVAFFVTLIAAASCATFNVKSNHPQTLWVGILGGPGIPNNGGFALSPGQQVTVTTADNWSGRFWPRTGCNFDANGNGHCDTGDCGNKLECNGAGGAAGVSLAEITCGSLAYYDISFVDGYNVAIEMAPVNKAADPNNKYSCGVAGCTANLISNCPAALQVKNSAGQVVECQSACLALGGDEYCCRGAHSTPQTCKSSDWPVDYAAYFKDACPNAYSYAYDDQSSTYTCSDNAYTITFT